MTGPSPRARWGLRAGVAIGLAIAAAATALTAISGVTSVDLPMLYSATAASFLIVGTLIAERRPGHMIGRLLLALGFLIVGYLSLDVWVRAPGPPPGAAAAAWLVTVSDGLWFFLIAMLFLMFPTGHLPTPGWRILVVATATAAMATFVLEALRAGPNAYYAWIENPVPTIAPGIVALWPVPYTLTVLCVVISALSLVVRWRHGGSVERTQLKWAAAAAAVIGLSMVSYGGGAGPGKYSEIGDLGVGLALGLFPVAIGIAVLRYRLYEIDRLISRTIGWAMVTGLLIAVFAGGVVALQAVLTGFTQGQTLAVAASTLIAFALFQPLRRRVQHAVDRRFDRARYDAERTVAAFSDRLRDEVDIEAVTTDFLTTARTSIRPTTASVWLRGIGR